MILGSAAASWAGTCGTPAAGAPFADAVHDRLRCELRRATGLVSSCTNPAATCAAQVDRVAALVFNGVTGIPAAGQ